MDVLDDMLDVRYVVVRHNVYDADNRTVLAVHKSFLLQVGANTLLAAGRLLVAEIKTG